MDCIIKAGVTLSRSSDGKIHLTIVDSESSTRFVEVLLAEESFTNMMFGRAEVEAEALVRNLEQVGKRRVFKARDIKLDCNKLKALGIEPYDTPKVEKLIEQRYQKIGWQLHASLRSQNSVTIENGVLTAKVQYVRYV